METMFSSSSIRPQRGLNRTMQYGNTENKRTVVRLMFGLNRTMQYGNVYAGRILPIVARFKSYYVVWKLHKTAKKYDSARRFKSYYVVWKLTKRLRDMKLTQSLNRTMQYGNFSRKCEVF